MDSKKIQEILDKNMKNLEVVEDSKPRVSADALNASQSTVSVKAIWTKYADNTASQDQQSRGQEASAQSMVQDPPASYTARNASGDDAKKIAVKTVRSKNIGADDPASAIKRAVIFNEGENNIEGFEG